MALNFVIYKTYPELKTDLSIGWQLSKKYPEIIIKIKQLFLHKIGGVALTQTSPIIIYAYASLNLVALYGNYMLIIIGITSLMSAVFNSMNAGVGNLVAEGNRPRIISVFKELFTLRFWLSSTVCFGVYMLTPAFITLWIGAEYVLDDLTLGLMVAILYINLTRLTVDAYINAYGLFGDIWAPVIEASLNIGCSVLLGYVWGLHGVLSGVLVSLILVIFIWKPYYLFRQGLKEKLNLYVILYFKHIIAGILALVCTAYIIIHLPLPDPSLDIVSLAIYGIIILCLFLFILAIFLYMIVDSMREFIHRVLLLVKH